MESRELLVARGVGLLADGHSELAEDVSRHCDGGRVRHFTLDGSQKFRGGVLLDLWLVSNHLHDPKPNLCTQKIIIMTAL